MKGTVVSFGRQGKDTVVKLEQAPRRISGILETKRIKITPLDGADAMARGQELMRLLGKHLPVREAISAALAQDAGSEPLYFHVQAASADELPWELLYQESSGFCALDARWPVGRIARQYREVKERGFRESLSIVAVLSAAGVSGMEQFTSLVECVCSDEFREVNAKLHVISGEQAILAAAAAAPHHITAEEIANDSGGVEMQISSRSPGILHILCHGGRAAGVRTLALATAADFQAGESTGLVRRKVADLVGALRNCNPWLLVLAACQTAEASDGAATAHELAEQGIPAVIGMRRLVDIGDTDRFCQVLYPEVMRTVAEALRPDRPEVLRDIDWAGALTRPRKAMSGDDPGRVDSWSDPVLYVQRDTLKVYRETQNAPMSLDEYNRRKAQLDQWMAWRVSLDPANTPDQALSIVDGQIARLRTELEGLA